MILWDERFAKVIKASASYVWESNVKISFLKIWKKTVKWGYFAESKSAKKKHKEKNYKNNDKEFPHNSSN